MKFNVSVPCKRYVKRFIENNYGSPVNFSKHPRENEMFRRMLIKPCYENECKYTTELLRQTEIVEIVVSDHDFYRYGWELTKTDIVSFGKHFENRAKLLMRTVVGIYCNFGMPVNTAIATFQSRFHMEEDYWPLETIQKDFYRLRECSTIDVNAIAYQHIERLIKINFANAGIIVDNALKTKEKRFAESG